MKILLTNDDGIYAPGLWALYRQFTAAHQVEVVAPERERSAVGHSITLHKPLRRTLVEVNGNGHGYAVNGTPADCVKLAILEILEDKPDLVISGINPGANVGVNLNYSGTVSAAKEAALYGLPAIAVSVTGRDWCNYDLAARFAGQLADVVIQNGLPAGTFLNVNVPNVAVHDISGVRISRQGIGMSAEYFEKRTDPRNRVYYWQGCDPHGAFDDPEIDGGALCHNFITVTPIRCDMTDYSMLDELRGWKLDWN